MLFDLQSPGRRGIIKVIYATLAILMGGGLIFFGIGSDATGGLSEVFTGNDGAGETGFEDQISEQEDKLVTNPQDVAALTELVQLHFQAGTSLIEVDESTGQQNVTAEAEEELQKGADSWDQLVKASKGEPALGRRADRGPDLLDPGPERADQGGRAAAARPRSTTPTTRSPTGRPRPRPRRRSPASAATPTTFARLASLYYFAGEIEQGDEAAAAGAGRGQGRGGQADREGARGRQEAGRADRRARSRPSARS